MVTMLSALFGGGGILAGNTSVTNSKFMQWTVIEEKSEAGNALRSEEEEWRKDRVAATESYRQYGVSLKNEARDQMKRDKTMYSLRRDDNLRKGQQVKADVKQQNVASARKKQEWMEHARSIKANTLAQRQRTMEAKIANVNRAYDMATLAKEAQVDMQRQREEVRNRLKEQRSALAHTMRSQTADEITDSAKDWSNEQRKSAAFATRAATMSWKAEREAQNSERLAKARQNRDATRATRQKAKELSLQLVAQRQAVASATRKQQQANKQAKSSVVVSSGNTAKDMHDAIIKQRYATQEQAEAVLNSKFAALIGIRPTMTNGAPLIKETTVGDAVTHEDQSEEKASQEQDITA